MANNLHNWVELKRESTGDSQIIFLRMKEGEVFIGTYASSTTNDKGKFPQMNHSFLNDDLKIVVINGSEVLDSKMKMAEQGHLVRVTFLGEKKSAKTGLMYKDYKVEQK